MGYFPEQQNESVSTNHPKKQSFIQQHHSKITPSLNEIIENIISQANPQKSDFIDPELRQHELQLHFNNSVVECLEEKLREQGPWLGENIKSSRDRQCAPKRAEPSILQAV